MRYWAEVRISKEEGCPSPEGISLIYNPPNMAGNALREDRIVIDS